MPLLRSKEQLLPVTMAAFLLAGGCASESIDTGPQSYCLASGEGSEFECNAESNALPQAAVDWENRARFQQMLGDITYPVLNRQPGLDVQSETLESTQGYTLQLASFRTRKRLDVFLSSLDNYQNIYLIKRDDGWHSVAYGFYRKYSEARAADTVMKKQGVRTWLRPVRWKVLLTCSDCRSLAEK